MRGLALNGATAAATVAVNVAMVFLLVQTGQAVNSLRVFRGDYDAVFAISAAAIGLTQLAWVLPAIVLLRKRQPVAAGIAIGASITFLLNAVFVGGLAVLCGGYLK